MFWDFYQFGRIQQASQDATEAKISARSAQSDAKNMQASVRYLEQQVERLTLALMAIAELLRDRGVPEAEIEAKVREIDLRDGQLDGRVTPTVKKCAGCGRVNGAKRTACLYCGAKLPGESSIL